MTLVHPIPAFFIVGTPRSGTTFVQRLATEIDGVGVPPETHFFSRYAMSSDLTFPLYGDELRGALEKYAARGFVSIDVDSWINALDGTATSWADLFHSLLRALEPGTPCIGEKTPAHLWWQAPLSRTFPGAKFVAVVRDPRGGVASLMKVPWAPKDPVALAQRWRHDQKVVIRAKRALGERCLVLRYEDVVADPDLARQRISQLLGRAQLSQDVGKTRSLFRPHEHWKELALQSVNIDRVDAWRHELSPLEQRSVESVCRSVMTSFGYDAPRVSLTHRFMRRARQPGRELSRLESRLSLERRAWRIREWNRSHPLGVARS